MIVEGLLPILLFVAFAIASVLEKAGKKPGGPGERPRPGHRPQQRPQQRPARPRHRVPAPPAQLPPRPAEGRADEMIPEDFWRELTGQARVPRAPAPAPVPAPRPESWDMPSWDEDAIAALEAAGDEEAELPEVRPLDDYRREVVIREAPVIVSLETPPLPPERRHAAFHQRHPEVSRPVPAPAPAAAAMPLLARLRDPRGARDAFVLSEVFGRAKGLE